MSNLFRVPSPVNSLLFPPKPTTKAPSPEADLEFVTMINAPVGNENDRDVDDPRHLSDVFKSDEVVFSFQPLKPALGQQSTSDLNSTTPARIRNLRNPFGHTLFHQTPKSIKTAELPSQTPLRPPNLLTELEIEAITTSQRSFGPSTPQSTTRSIFDIDVDTPLNRDSLSNGNSSFLRHSNISVDFGLPSPLGNSTNGYEVQSLVSKCAAYETKVKELRSQIGKLSFTLNKTIALNATKKKDLDDTPEIESNKLEGDEDSLQKSISTLQEELKQQRLAFQEKEQHLEEAMQELEMTQDEHDKELDELETDYNRSIAASQQIISDLRAQLEQTQTLKLDGSLGPASDVTLGSDEKLQSIISEQEELILVLEEKLDEFAAADEEREQHTQEAENAKLEAERQLVEKIESEKLLRLELLDKDSQLQFMKLGEMGQEGELYLDNKSLRTRMSQMKTDYTTLLTQKEKAEADVSTLQQRILEQSAELSNTFKDSGQAQHQFEAAKDELARQVESLEEVSRQQQLEIETHRKDAGQAYRDLQAVSELLEKRNSEFAALEKDIARGDTSAKAQIETLDLEISERDVKIESLRAELDNAVLESEDWQNLAEEREDQIAKLDADQKKMEETIGDWKSLVDKREGQIVDLDLEKKAMQGTIADLQKEVEVLESTLEEMEADQDEMNSRIAELGEELIQSNKLLEEEKASANQAVVDSDEGDDDGSVKAISAEDIDNLIRERDQLRAEVEALEERALAGASPNREDETAILLINESSYELEKADLEDKVQSLRSELDRVIQDRDTVSVEHWSTVERLETNLEEQRYELDALADQMAGMTTGATTTDTGIPTILPPFSSSTTRRPTQLSGDLKIVTTPALPTPLSLSASLPSPSLAEFATSTPTDPAPAPATAELTTPTAMETATEPPACATNPESDDLSATAEIMAALRYQHVLEVRGLAKQINLMRALLVKEQRFRHGLVFQKKYLSSQLDLYDAFNRTNLQVLEGIPAFGSAEQGHGHEQGHGRGQGRGRKAGRDRGEEPDFDFGLNFRASTASSNRRNIRGRGDAVAVSPIDNGYVDVNQLIDRNGRPCRSPTCPRISSIRSVAFAVMAISRMKAMSASWASTKKTQEALARKMAERRKRAQMNAGVV